MLETNLLIRGSTQFPCSGPLSTYFTKDILLILSTIFSPGWSSLKMLIRKLSVTALYSCKNFSSVTRPVNQSYHIRKFLDSLLMVYFFMQVFDSFMTEIFENPAVVRANLPAVYHNPLTNTFMDCVQFIQKKFHSASTHIFVQRQIGFIFFFRPFKSRQIQFFFSITH